MSNLSPPPSRDKLPVVKDQGGKLWAEHPLAWQKWFSEIKELLAPVATSGLLPWSSISKVGSNLTDLLTRNHADLQNINTATYTHLSATNATDLTDGGLTTLHKHDTQGINYPASLTIGTPTDITNLQILIDHSWSSGVVDGCALTDNGDGTIAIASGNATIRSSASPHAPLYNVGTPAQASIALTNDAVNYIYLDYGGGVPLFVASVSPTSFNGMDKVITWLVHRNGTLIHSLDGRNINVDNARKDAHMSFDVERFVHAFGGTVLGNPSALTISVTSGHFYFMLNELPHDAFDTSVAGTANANVFMLWNHVAGVYTETINQKSVGTLLYDDGTGTAALGNNKYGVTWFYIINDSPSELHAIMGQAEYANAAEAEVAAPPTSLPTLIDGLGVLVGFVTYEKGAAAFTNIKSAFTAQFGASAAVLHNGLSGLQGGTTNEYYHLTNANYLLATNFNFRAFAAAQG